MEAGGRAEATVGESVLAMTLWGMLYADDAGVVLQSPEQLKKMMWVIVVVCTAFGLTVSEAKTEIMCLRAKGMPESTATFSVEAAGQVYTQTDKFVYFGGNVHHNADLSIEVDRRMHNAWCSFRKYTLELYAPTERFPRTQNPDAKNRGTRDNAVRLRHVGPARVPLRHAAPNPPQVLDSLHRLARAQSRRPSGFLSGHAYQDEKRGHRGDFTQEADLVCRICGAYGRYETAEMRGVPRNGEGRGLFEGAGKKSVWGVSWTTSKLSASTPISGRLQPRTRENGTGRWNKRRNISWQNGSLQRKPRLDYGMQWYART